MIFWQGPSSNPWDEVAMDQERGLHAEQEFTFFGAPPRAGTRLKVRSTITDVFEKEGKRGGTLTFAVMVTDFLSQDGVLVAQSKLTGVETSRPPEEPS
jgi:acyl dehydratase